jgi:hypothetical protein
MESKGVFGGLIDELKSRIAISEDGFMNDHWHGYKKGIQDAIREIEKVAKWERLLGKNRDQVVRILGEPDVKGGITKRYPCGRIYKYGEIELWFQPWKMGNCYSVFDESKHQMIVTR